MRFSGIRRRIAVFVTALSLINISVLAQQNAVTAAQELRPATAAAVTAGTRAASEVEPLKGLIEEALAKNPEIQAMARSFDMMRARIPQAKALPDPMLEYGTVGNIVPIPPFDIQKGDPSSARRLSISQEIPFPGKQNDPRHKDRGGAMNRSLWLASPLKTYTMTSPVNQAKVESGGL